MILEIMLIIVGLILLTGVLMAIPALGTHLEKLGKWLGSFQTIIGIVGIIIAIIYFSLIMGLALIIASFILIAGILPAIPALGKYLEELAKILAGFQVPIGVIAFLLGILGLLGII
jgi:uncharacterized membrane protein HdeD (DUF308 family)